jgi:hypothetical protein
MNTTRRPRTTGPSAGIDVPGSESAAGADGGRVAELEERLARLERRVTLRDRGRSMMEKVVPPEAGHHFRQAGRHQLLGVRAIVDFWIERIDRREARAEAAGSEPERIDIE